MQIVNYFRARVFHSSNAAANLAINNEKHTELAERIVSVKMSSAQCDLMNLHLDPIKKFQQHCKILKYTYILKSVSLIKKPFPETTNRASNDYLNNLPELKMSKPRPMSECW